VLEKGDSLATEDVPTCKQITGHTVNWDVTDFTTITADKDVLAVATPNTYKITYQLSSGEQINGEKTQNVVYGTAYTLVTPTHTDKTLDFSHWKNVATGEKISAGDAWKIAGDVTLKAVWVESGDWSKNY
jgi:hypothetical protein